MNKFTKAIAAIILIVAAIVVAGCNKPDEPNNGGNNGNNDSDVRVTTYTPQDITGTTAKCGGDAIVVQGLSLTEIGVCWSKEQNPTVSDGYLSTTDWNQPFVCTITNLDRNTCYHVRAYALRGLQYYYGEDKSFNTLESGGGWDGQDGALPGVFSVSETRKVHFSQGNLQYQASTNTWRFAERQWDYVGTHTPDTLGNMGGTIVGSDNAYISSSYNGWIDLFAWGTSGYNHGAMYYQPWSTSQDNTGYQPYGSNQSNLNDQTGMADWGYNAISNGGNLVNIWRTLTSDEWTYLFDTRVTVSGARWTKATVNNTIGIVLLPDNWSGNVYNLNNVNDATIDFTVNVISVNQWITLENSGAVFLPAAGSRKGLAVNAVGYSGLYWSTTRNTAPYRACILAFYNNQNSTFFTTRSCGVSLGNSVRLVCSAE